MEAQIQILVENMQSLQTKLTSMENKQQDHTIRKPVHAIIMRDQNTWQKVAEDNRY